MNNFNDNVQNKIIKITQNHNTKYLQSQIMIMMMIHPIINNTIWQKIQEMMMAVKFKCNHKCFHKNHINNKEIIMNNNQ